MRRPKSQHQKQAYGPGFTLIELAVAVSIVALAAGLLLNRISFYQEQAEKAAMEQTVGIIRSALHLQVASLIAKDKAHLLPDLVNQNPMNWLAEKPGNYLGEYFAPKPQDIQSGNWYFDLQNRNLIYLIANNAHFQSADKQQNQIRFRVRVVHDERAQGDKSTDVEGVILDQASSYKWF